MRLNLDCIRDILLTVEATTDLSTEMDFGLDSDVTYELLTKYPVPEVLYHIKQCELSDLLTEVHWYADEDCTIFDLSPYGHQFIADIRSDNNWNKTKTIAKTIGASSLSSIKEIATSVIAELIKSQLQNS